MARFVLEDDDEQIFVLRWTETNDNINDVVYWSMDVRDEEDKYEGAIYNHRGGPISLIARILSDIGDKE